MSEEMKLLRALCDALGFQVITIIESKEDIAWQVGTETDYKLIKKEATE